MYTVVTVVTVEHVQLMVTRVAMAGTSYEAHAGYYVKDK